MNASSNTSIEYGGIMFFHKNLSEYLPYSILYILGFVSGFFGNYIFNLFHLKLKFICINFKKFKVICL